MGARVSQPRTQALILPDSGSLSLQIFRLNGPAAICHCVWNQQMRSGIEMVDCEKLRALARPDSLNGRPAQSSGFGPAPRSRLSSLFFEVHDPERSISASAGNATHSNMARVRIVLLRVIFDSCRIQVLMTSTIAMNTPKASTRSRQPVS